jgi:hypothetical protein
MRYLRFVSAVALLPMVQPALAAPEISGSYSLSSTELCQAVLKTDGARTPGVMKNGLAVANFDNSSGTVSGTLAEIGGDLVVWTNATTGLSQDSRSFDVSYSNTGTTFTVNGVTLNVAYGSVQGGIAQSFQWNGANSNGCLIIGTAIHQ